MTFNESNVVERTSLHFADGNSNKFYVAYILLNGSTFSVMCNYGRVGTAGAWTTKADGVNQSKAYATYYKVLNEKQAKGYSLVSSSSNSNAQPEAKPSPAKPALPRQDIQRSNPVSHEEAQRLIATGDWVAQQKFDGRRLRVHVKGESVIGFNKLGAEGIVDPEVTQALLRLTHHLNIDTLMLDSEAMDGHIKVFDVLAFGGADLADKRFAERATYLPKLSTWLDVSKTAQFIQPAQVVKANEFQGFVVSLIDSVAEGYVLRKLSGVYANGKPNSGGDVLKCKFVEEATVIAGDKKDDKRSVAMLLIDEATGERINVGYVTIPPNKDVPSAGQLIEVRYLYAYHGGCLIQPTFKELRDDVNESDCTTAQLKYKVENAA